MRKKILSSLSTSTNLDGGIGVGVLVGLGVGVNVGVGVCVGVGGFGVFVGIGVIVGVTSSASTLVYVPLIIPTLEIGIGLGDVVGCIVGEGVVSMAVCLPSVNMYCIAPPITTRKIGSAIRGTDIFKSKVVVCFFLISSSQ